MKAEYSKLYEKAKEVMESDCRFPYDLVLILLSAELESPRDFSYLARLLAEIETPHERSPALISAINYLIRKYPRDYVVQSLKMDLLMLRPMSTAKGVFLSISSALDMQSELAEMQRKGELDSELDSIWDKRYRPDKS